MPRISHLSLASLALLLAACFPSALPPATLTLAPPPQATAAIAATIAAPAVTAAPADPTISPVPPTAEAAPTATEAAVLYDGLAQGQTAGGFPALGDPNAPVALIDYSDFL